jgi:nicotinate-nucleotide--dimethylbenzimidazole phosphoribosyltransferase
MSETQFDPNEATFDEIRKLLRELPGPDLESGTATVSRETQLTKPRGSLGRLEELAEWLATWQGRHPPRVQHPRTAVYAGNHGIAARGVSAYPQEVTAQMVQNFIAGGAAVNQLCEAFDSDLRVYELALEKPTDDFTQGPAMDEDACARAMAYGMMSVEPGLDVLCLGEMGIGNTTSAAALGCALFGGEPKDWVGAGTGVEGSTLKTKIDVVAEGVARHKNAGDPLQLLAALGGVEFAAIAGAVIAARLARTPVVLDGFACTVAASVLWMMDRRALDHCIVAHRSVEPGHTKVMALIGKEPLFDLGMRLGEGSGATLAIGLLKAAAACHSGMATFAEAGVSGAGGH